MAQQGGGAGCGFADTVCAFMTPMERKHRRVGRRVTTTNASFATPHSTLVSSSGEAARSLQRSVGIFKLWRLQQERRMIFK